MRGDLVGAGAVRAVQQQRRQKAHAAQRGGLLVGRQKGVEEIAVVAVGAVRVLGAAGARDQPHVLAAQRLAAGAVGPAEGEHVVEPQLHERRHRVPVHRVQPHDQARVRERSLFGGGVDQVVRVQRVQVAHLDPRRQRPGRFDQRAAHARDLELRVRGEHQHLWRGCGRRCGFGHRQAHEGNAG